MSYYIWTKPGNWYNLLQAVCRCLAVNRNTFLFVTDTDLHSHMHSPRNGDKCAEAACFTLCKQSGHVPHACAVSPPNMGHGSYTKYRLHISPFLRHIICLYSFSWSSAVANHCGDIFRRCGCTEKTFKLIRSQRDVQASPCRIKSYSTPVQDTLHLDPTWNIAHRAMPSACNSSFPWNNAHNDI